MPRTAPAESRAADQLILDCIRVLFREIRTSSAATEQATGLSAAQVFVLRALVREPGLSVNALARRTLTHQSSVSVVVRKLVAAGLVVRRPVVGDGRSVALDPTASGRVLAKRSADPIQERFLQSLDRLPLGVRQRLATDLGHWITAMGIDVAEPEMFFESKLRG